MQDVVIRFAGDSGDGIQLTGSQFTNATAIFGNDLSTLPDFPAEIRAPAGTLPGVSGFQVRIASYDIHTPGDESDVLVAMNPAALKVNVREVAPGGLIIVNRDSFTARELQKAGYTTNPLEDGTLAGYRVIEIELTRLNRAALESTGLGTREVDRCKNFFVLGMVLHLFDRPIEPIRRHIEEKFGKNPALRDANLTALRAGIAYCEATEVLQVETDRFSIPPASLPPGSYRNLSGNHAIALGLVAAARQSGLGLYLAGYPITPASDILHEVSRFKDFGILTFQAEDEIGAVCAAIGASYAGRLGVTATSGPGLDLKAEAIGLAITAELPLVILDIQRAGPSTGMPTKTEQSDLMLALFGRHGESPLPVLAPSSPGDCFWTVIEAARLAVKYVTPVIVLSDGFLANGSEPWKIPAVEDLPDFRVEFPREAPGFHPYERDPKTLARPWVLPGTPGLEHRIGGLEKADVTGHVSYDPDNHERMTKLRAEKVARITQEIPATQLNGSPDADILVVGWGSTLGAITDALERLREDRVSVASVHLRYLNPLPADLGPILKRAKRVLVPEVNSGQLVRILRDRYLVDAESISRVRGRPLRVSELVNEIRARSATTEQGRS
jgi:2-oxoglutarate ferredoxin oxidoreductase subunit alpha